MHVACAVAGDDRHRRVLSAERADLRDRHLIVRQNLKQKRLKLIIAAIELINQQHGRRRACVIYGLQQWSPQ